MITIEDKGDEYEITTDMDDGDTIQALAHAVAQMHVDHPAQIGHKAGHAKPDDWARAARAAGLAFGLMVETCMEKTLERQAGLQ